MELLFKEATHQGSFEGVSTPHFRRVLPTLASIVLVLFAVYLILSVFIPSKVYRLAILPKPDVTVQKNGCVSTTSDFKETRMFWEPLETTNLTDCPTTDTGVPAGVPSPVR